MVPLNGQTPTFASRDSSERRALIGGVDSDTRKASMACDYKVCSSHWEQVQFLPNQFIEKTTRLPLPEDRLSAVEWGHGLPLCLYLLKGFSMLVLSRRPNEVIRIGDDIKITVTKLRDGRAWIGVDAPKHIKVVREEIRLAINTEATATDSDCD